MQHADKNAHTKRMNIHTQSPARIQTLSCHTRLLSSSLILSYLLALCIRIFTLVWPIMFWALHYAYVLIRTYIILKTCFMLSLSDASASFSEQNAISFFFFFCQKSLAIWLWFRIVKFFFFTFFFGQDASCRHIKECIHWIKVFFFFWSLHCQLWCLWLESVFSRHLRVFS